MTARADLSRERDQRNAIHLGVGNRRDQIQRPRPARGHANARFSGGAGQTLCRKTTPLLVPRQNGANLILETGERLMQRHAGAAWIGENNFDTVVHQRLDNHIGAGHQSACRTCFTYDCHEKTSGSMSVCRRAGFSLTMGAKAACCRQAKA